MKKIALTLISCTLLFFACKKENEEFVGTYTGVAHYHDLGSNDYWDENVTVNVALGNEPHQMRLTGDILNYYVDSPNTFNVTFKSNSNSLEEGGYFRNDSLVFFMHDKHWFVEGLYYLKKQ
jgi:hypothetical protein